MRRLDSIKVELKWLRVEGSRRSFKHVSVLYMRKWALDNGKSIVTTSRKFNANQKLTSLNKTKAWKRVKY